MEIKELEKTHFESVKNLLVELQNYIVEIDKYNLNILTKEYKEKYFKYMVRDCKGNKGKIFVALDNNCDVVGMVAGFVQKYEQKDKLDYKCPKKGVVAELIVSKNARHSGCGTKLLDVMENYFKIVGCKYCQIDVFAYNENALKFYYDKGYEDRMKTVFKQL